MLSRTSASEKQKPLFPVKKLYARGAGLATLDSSAETSAAKTTYPRVQPISGMYHVLVKTTPPRQNTPGWLIHILRKLTTELEILLRQFSLRHIPISFLPGMRGHTLVNRCQVQYT